MLAAAFLSLLTNRSINISTHTSRRQKVDPAEVIMLKGDIRKSIMYNRQLKWCMHLAKECGYDFTLARGNPMPTLWLGLTCQGHQGSVTVVRHFQPIMGGFPILSALWNQPSVMTALVGASWGEMVSDQLSRNLLHIDLYPVLQHHFCSMRPVQIELVVEDVILLPQQCRKMLAHGGGLQQMDHMQRNFEVAKWSS